MLSVHKEAFGILLFDVFQKTDFCLNNKTDG